MKTLEMLFLTMRPYKWSRSIIVFLPLLFSGDPLNWVYLIKIGVAFLIFSFLTGTVFVIEDLANIEVDKSDPLKKLMPIASGELSKNKAEFAIVTVLIGSFVAAFFLGPWVGVCSIAYFALRLLNLLCFSKLPYVKFVTSGIASIIIILSGTIAISKPLPNWLLFFVFCASIFISLCNEMRSILSNKSKGIISVDTNYEQVLLQTITIICTTTLIGYTMFSLSTLEGIAFNLIFSFPLVLFGSFRILILTFDDKNESQLEKIILKDWQFMANVAIWVILVSILIKFS